MKVTKRKRERLQAMPKMLRNRDDKLVCLKYVIMGILAVRFFSIYRTGKPLSFRLENHVGHGQRPY